MENHKRLHGMKDVFEIMATYRFPIDRTWAKLTNAYRLAVGLAMAEGNYASINGPEGFYNAMRAYANEDVRNYRIAEKVHVLMLDNEEVYRNADLINVVRIRDFHGGGIIRTERISE